MSRTGKIVAVVAAVIVVCGFACVAVMGISAVLGSTIVGGESVGIVRIEGTISAGAGGATLGSAATDNRVIADLEKAARDRSVAAVVLAINSPGGSVYASDRIYAAVAAMEKPVVAYLGETAASGGYYVACGAREIVAHPATLTGSIGVIMQTYDASGLLERLGITWEVHKSAEHKDMGSPSRGLTDEERAILQAIIDENYYRFVDIVAEARGLSREAVLEVADGRVLTGTSAVEHGLADSTGDLDDAIAVAWRLAGLDGTPRSVELTSSPTVWESLMSSASDIGALVGGGTTGLVMQYRLP